MMTSRGFTLIELLVAVVIFSVGLLALMSSASVMMTQLSSAQGRTVAAAVAESRFERIRATACASRPASGSAVTRGISETWTRTPLARADDVTVVVQYSTRTGSHSQTFESYIPC